MTSKVHHVAPTAYNYDYAKELCDITGLKYNHAVTLAADPVFAEAEMTQEQVDQMIYLWTRLVCWMWDRKSYGWAGRIALALYFLGFGKRIKGNAN